MPQINIKSIPKDVSFEDSNMYIQNIPDLTSSSFVVDWSLFWKGYGRSFKIRDIKLVDLTRPFVSLSDKTSMYILEFACKIIKMVDYHITDYLSYIINDSLINDRCPGHCNLPRVTPGPHFSYHLSAHN